jgi:hypothetical protein
MKPEEFLDFTDSVRSALNLGEIHEETDINFLYEGKYFNIRKLTITQVSDTEEDGFVCFEIEPEHKETKTMYNREFLEQTYLNLATQLCWAVDFQALSKHPTDFLVSRIINGFTQMQKKLEEQKTK